MLITFARVESGSTVATIRRRDGVVLELPGYDKKDRVPHDLAHAVTESELGMPRGVFGSIAGGGVFANMRVLAGRERHDAADRSARLLAANKSTLGVAEVMAAVVHDVVEHAPADAGPVDHGKAATALAEARRVWGVLSAEPLPWTQAQLADAIARLAGLAADYDRDGLVHVDWPDRLTSPVPDRPGRRRGRRGRV